MMWILLAFMFVILLLILVIIYLMNKLDELQMYKNDIEVKKLMLRINYSEVSSDAEN